MLARAKIHRAEESLQSCVSDGITGISRRGVEDASRTVDSDTWRCPRTEVAEGNIENGVVHLHRSVVDQRGSICPSQVRCETLDKRISVVAHDMIGGINAALHQATYFLGNRNVGGQQLSPLFRAVVAHPR